MQTHRSRIRGSVTFAIFLALAILGLVATVSLAAAGDPSMGGLAIAADASATSSDEVLPNIPHDKTSMILALVLPALLAGAGWIGKRVDRWLEAKTENETLESFLLTLNHHALSVVKELMQTMVPEYQKAGADGKITVEEARRLKGMAVDAVMARLGLKGQAKAAKLGFVGNILLDLVGSQVEAAVHDVKLQRNAFPQLVAGKLLAKEKSSGGARRSVSED